jgi:acetyl esterase/lipase
MTTKYLSSMLCLAATAVSSVVAQTAAPAAPAKPAAPAAPAVRKPVTYSVQPTLADVAYGPHKKQVLHFWKAASDKPTPLLFYIHGGGWMGGDRTGAAGFLDTFLKSGISVVSVEYRFIPEATADKVVPPVKGPLSDAARALQFVRSKAAEWNIDKERIGASGGSAGACSSLWLAFHDDMADPKSADPIARESTRLWCAAVDGAQTTLDPAQMKEWTPNSSYGGHAFGFNADRVKKTTQFDEFLAKRDTILPWIAEYSPYALVTSDDPPIYMHYGEPPALGQTQRDPTHTSNFGVKLQEHLKAAGVPCELSYPKAPASSHASAKDYLFERLKAAKS